MSNQTTGEDTHLRGARIGSRAAVVEEMDKLRPEGDPGIYWGGLQIPSEDGPRHFCVMGATGSGKTVLLRLLMQSVLPRISSTKITTSSKLPQRTVPDQTVPQRTALAQAVPAKIQSNGMPEHPLITIALDGHWIYPRLTLIGFIAFIAGGAAVVIYDNKLSAINSVVVVCIAIFLSKALLWRNKVVLSRQDQIRRETDFAKAITLACWFSDGHTIRQFFNFPPGYPLWKKWRGTLEITPEDIEKYAITPPVEKVLTVPLVETHQQKRDGSTTAPTKRHRALVYDSKQDAASLVRAINPRSRIVILNPFDTRCAAWDMAKDITKPSTADQVATILIPENKSASQPFFANAARQILGGVFKAFILIKPGTWDFRDVVLATKSKERLIGLLEKTPYTRDLVGQYFGNQNTVDSLLSELGTYMGPYEHIAATWSRATEKVSLTHWIENEYILLLGNDEAHRAALDAVNRLIFQRLTEIVLAQPETDTEQTWIFLDEVREAGELEGLSLCLLNKGRSKGACVVLGFQDVDGMRSVYGDKIANEIIGQCNHMAMLRLNSPDTAKWASERIGECETIDEESSCTSGEGSSTQTSANTGVSRHPGWIFKPATSLDAGESSSTSAETSNSSTTNQKKVIKAAVLPSEFLHLPLTNRANGLTGFFIVPQVRAGAYRCEIPGTEIFPLEKSKAVLLPPDPTFPNFIERPPEDEYLAPLTKEEMELFQKAPEPSSAKVEEKKPTVTPTPPPAPPSATTDPKTPGSVPTPGKVMPPKNIREKALPSPSTESPATPTPERKSTIPDAPEDEIKRLNDILKGGKL